MLRIEASAVTRPKPAMKALLRLVRRLVLPRHPDVAAEQRPPLLRQPGQERLAERSHARDGGDAQRQRGEKDAESRNPAPEFPARIADGQARARSPVALLGHNKAVLHVQDAVAACGQGLFVRHQEQRRARARPQREQQIDDGSTRGAVEISGRLVGEQHFGLVHDGARQRHALLLAARKLARIVIEPMLERHRFERLCRLGERIAPPQQLQRHGDVLERGHRRHEMERLEHDADMLAPEPRQLILAERVQPLPGDRHAARASPPPDPAATISSDDLPEPDGPSSASASPCATFERNAVQNVDRSRRARQCQAHVFDLNRRRAHLFGRVVIGAGSRIQAFSGEVLAVRRMRL